MHPSGQSNAREPGENPGRLRHCNGYKFQGHHPAVSSTSVVMRVLQANGAPNIAPTGSWRKSGVGRRNEIRSPSQDTGLIALVAVVGAAVVDRCDNDRLLRKEKDEASRSDRFRLDSLDAFVPRFAELKAFLFVGPVVSSSSSQRIFEDADEDENGNDLVPLWSLKHQPECGMGVLRFCNFNAQPLPSTN